MARNFRRKKYCRFTAEGIKEIDYKDLDMLKQYITENGQDRTQSHYRYQCTLPAPVGAGRQAGTASWHCCPTRTNTSRPRLRS